MNFSNDVKGANDLSSSLKYDIEIFNLTKKYKVKTKDKEILALDNVNLKVKSGEIFGLLGPNGAGKTTMVSILTTLIQPSSGYAEVYGYNILKDKWYIKKNVAVMLGKNLIYHRLTGFRNLEFFCKLYNIKNYKLKISEIANTLELSKWLNEYVEKYSTGMKAKLALARVLLLDPQVLFLDEPMVGIDPNSVKTIINVLKNLKKTIFLTSHRMDIISQLCDRLAFLKEGKILKVDTKKNFEKLITDKVMIKIKMTKPNKDLINLLTSTDFISDIREADNYIIFFMKNENFYPKLFEILYKYPITELNDVKPSLEDIFLKLSN